MFHLPVSELCLNYQVSAEFSSQLLFQVESSFQLPYYKKISICIRYKLERTNLFKLFFCTPILPQRSRNTFNPLMLVKQPKLSNMPQKFFNCSIVLTLHFPQLQTLPCPYSYTWPCNRQTKWSSPPGGSG